MPKATSALATAVRVLVSIVLSASLLGAGFFAFRLIVSARKKPEREATHRPRTAVRVQIARRQSYRETYHGYGLARAMRSAELKAEVAALVTWVSPDAEVGKSVSKGDELIKLDDSDLRDSLATAEASLAKSQAIVEGFKTEKEELAKQIAAAQKELSAARAGTKAKIAGLEAQKAALGKQIEIARRELASSHTRAQAAVEGLDADKGAAGAQLLIARKELETGKRELGRSKALSKTDLVSQSELDQQILRVATLERTVLELEARLESTGPAIKRARADADAGARERSVSELEGQLESLSHAVKEALAAPESATRERMVVELEGRLKSIGPSLLQALADVETRRAQLAMSKRNLARSVIHAPFSGEIQARHVQAGERVTPGTPLLSITDSTRLEIAVPLPSSVANEFPAEAQARLRLQRDGEVIWQGAVSRRAPAINETDRTLQVFLEIGPGQCEPPILPGTFVQAEIDGLLHENVFVIPRDALIEDRLYVARRTGTEGGESTVESRRPQVKRLFQDVALITGGLEPGDEVVLTSVEKIGNGTLVTVAPNEDGSLVQSPALSQGGDP